MSKPGLQFSLPARSQAISGHPATFPGALPAQTNICLQSPMEPGCYEESIPKTTEILQFHVKKKKYPQQLKQETEIQRKTQKVDKFLDKQLRDSPPIPQ